MRFFLFLAAVLILCGTAQSEEIKLTKHPLHIHSPRGLFTSVHINNLEDLPHDFAKHLEPEMYYWWAKAYNAKQWARYGHDTDSGTFRIINHGTLNTRGNFGRGSLGYTNKTFLRQFSTKNGGGPATFYNPYFR